MTGGTRDGATPARPRRDDEPALKARAAAQFMGAVANLADHGPDDFHRRILARPAFAYAFEFVRWARRARNQLKSDATTLHARRQIKAAVEKLAKLDLEPYEVVRHKLAAHRQPAEGGDPVERSTAGQRTWDGIDAAVVHILAEDARVVTNLLMNQFDMPELQSFAPVPPGLAKAAAGLNAETGGLQAGVGSFDRTRPDAVPVTQGGVLGERQREIVDVVRQIQVYSELAEPGMGHEPFWRIIVGVVATEACTLAELLYGGSSQGIRSLLELLSAPHYSHSPAGAILRRYRATLDARALEHARRLRNALGAHIDEDKPLSDLLKEYETFEPDMLNGLLEHLFAVVSAIAASDVLLATLRLSGSVLEGWSLHDPPDPPPY